MNGIRTQFIWQKEELKHSPFLSDFETEQDPKVLSSLPFVCGNLWLSGLPPHLGHHRGLRGTPCAMQLVLPGSIRVSVPSPSSSHPPPSLGIHTFVLYIGVPISALQIKLWNATEIFLKSKACLLSFCIGGRKLLFLVTLRF